MGLLDRLGRPAPRSPAVRPEAERAIAELARDRVAAWRDDPGRVPRRPPYAITPTGASGEVVPLARRLGRQPTPQELAAFVTAWELERARLGADVGRVMHGAVELDLPPMGRGVAAAPPPPGRLPEAADLFNGTPRRR